MRKYDEKPIDSMTCELVGQPLDDAVLEVVAPPRLGPLEGEVAEVVVVGRRSRPGSGNVGSCGLPNSIVTSARSAIHSVLSHASGSSWKRWRISCAGFR